MPAGDPSDTSPTLGRAETGSALTSSGTGPLRITSGSSHVCPQPRHPHLGPHGRRPGRLRQLRRLQGRETHRHVDRGYRAADGTRPSDGIQLETYLRPETEFERTPFAFLHQGDKAAFEYELRSSTYADKNGEVQYRQVAYVTDVALLDSRATSNARLAQRLTAAQGVQQAQPAPAASLGRVGKGCHRVQMRVAARVSPAR